MKIDIRCASCRFMKMTGRARFTVDKCKRWLNGEKLEIVKGGSAV